MAELKLCDVCNMPIRREIKKELDYFGGEEGKYRYQFLAFIFVSYGYLLPDMCFTCRKMVYENFNKWIKDRKKQVERLTIEGE